MVLVLAALVVCVDDEKVLEIWEVALIDDDVEVLSDILGDDEVLMVFRLAVFNDGDLVFEEIC